MSFHAVAVPRRDYDHHHRRDNSGLCARVHHHPDDTVQGGSPAVSLNPLWSERRDNKKRERFIMREDWLYSHTDTDNYGHPNQWKVVGTWWQFLSSDQIIKINITSNPIPLVPRISA